jgi:hypothetical protein
MTNGTGSIKGVPRGYDKIFFEVINVMSKNKMPKNRYLIYSIVSHNSVNKFIITP